MKSIRSRAWILVAAGFLLVIPMLWGVLGPPDPSPQAVTSSPSTQSKVEEASPSSDTEGATGARWEGGSTTGQALLRGRVVDDVFGVPVFASIELDSGQSCTSDPRSGDFTLELHSEWSAVVKAKGYLRTEFSGAMSNVGRDLEFRLVPRRATTLLVRNADGTPASRCRIEWRASSFDRTPQDNVSWFVVDEHAGGESFSTRTDSQGRSTVNLAVLSTATIFDDHSGTRQVVLVEPGSESLQVLPERGVKMRFEQAESGSPVVGLDVQVWDPLDPLSMCHTIRTDREGVVTLPADRSPLLMKPSVEEGQALKVASGSGLVAASDGASGVGVLRLVSPESDEPFVVEVASPADADLSKIKLIDSTTGLPVQGEVTVGLRELPQRGGSHLAPSARYTMRAPDAARSESEVLPLNSGELKLPRRMTWGSESEYRLTSDLCLTVAARGYRPLVVRDVAAALSPGGPTPVYELDEAMARSIRVEFEDGTPYVGPLAILSPVHQVFCLGSSGRFDGHYGPFDWYGGDVHVITDWLGGFQRSPMWVLHSEKFESEETASLVLPQGTGAILVEGIPGDLPASDLIAQRKGLPQEYSPTQFTRGECAFTGLPSGEYFVGPRAWLRGAVANSSRSDGLSSGPGGSLPAMASVEPGVTARVSWKSFWGAESAYTGYVSIRGNEELRPFLIPLYGGDGPDSWQYDGQAPRVVISAARERVRLGSDGEYVIPEGDPVPILIAVCASSDRSWCDINGIHILDVIRPNESTVVKVGSVELTWEEPPFVKDGRVMYRVPSSELRHPVKGPACWSSTVWPVGTVLRLNSVPVSVDRLIVNGREVPLQMEVGQTEEILFNPLTFPEAEGAPAY